MKRKYKPRIRADANQKKYLNWVRGVKSRDGYRCQMPRCRYKGRCLQCHHIYRYADAPSLRYSVSNGITLCYKCHKKITGHEYIWASLFKSIVRKNGKV